MRTCLDEVVLVLLDHGLDDLDSLPARPPPRPPTRDRFGADGFAAGGGGTSSTTSSTKSRVRKRIGACRMMSVSLSSLCNGKYLGRGLVNKWASVFLHRTQGSDALLSWLVGGAITCPAGRERGSEVAREWRKSLRAGGNDLQSRKPCLLRLKGGGTRKRSPPPPPSILPGGTGGRREDGGRTEEGGRERGGRREGGREEGGRKEGGRGGEKGGRKEGY